MVIKGEMSLDSLVFEGFSGERGGGAGAGAGAGVGGGWGGSVLCEGEKERGSVCVKE